ncbi:STAS domain-containing protein [Lacinutrix sp. C3R15]|uniref:STAS domain-containing protein n=1 Tax=Flavobacteriaceae TaxID=49546 RepID=UPI001C08DC35|nr:MULTISPECIES: STAS domain-containing protein [Flavobacteriaceae]MBU2938178.1 STAS domain-containing protein [Lacinutrix sp. C3R15]MDO6621492.1 STAS domain-containing protein [Oceanihabitans sp. 1_MG-2023]
MALTITQKENIITLEGALNASTLNSFKNYFSLVLNTSKNFTLNIDKVTEIDVSGMRVLKEMYRNAIHNNNIFFVVGYGCKDIYEDFKCLNVA